MKHLALIAALTAIAFPAMAQWNTNPDIYGQPQFGVTTTGPHGQRFHTEPQIYGRPDLGTTTTGPNGVRCSTTPQIYGQPQFGSTTTCN